MWFAITVSLLSATWPQLLDSCLTKQLASTPTSHTYIIFGGGGDESSTLLLVPVSTVFSFVVVITSAFQWFLKITSLYFLLTLCCRLWVSSVEIACDSPPEPRLKEQPAYEISWQSTEARRLAQICVAASSFCLGVMYITSVHILCGQNIWHGQSPNQ